jgi:hypothetical protein
VYWKIKERLGKSGHVYSLQFASEGIPEDEEKIRKSMQHPSISNQLAPKGQS